jgi:hypothetical protein
MRGGKGAASHRRTGCDPRGAGVRGSAGGDLADKSVRYEEVIDVMDVLRQQQIKKVAC